MFITFLVLVDVRLGSPSKKVGMVGDCGLLSAVLALDSRDYAR